MVDDNYKTFQVDMFNVFNNILKSINSNSREPFLLEKDKISMGASRKDGFYFRIIPLIKDSRNNEWAIQIWINPNGKNIPGYVHRIVVSKSDGYTAKQLQQARNDALTKIREYLAKTASNPRRRAA